MLVPVSVIIPMKNSATTVIKTLESIVKQTYPVKEIFVIDNVSKDNSCDLVKVFKKRAKVPVTLIERKINKGVGASYNLGVSKASSKLVVFIHSDSTLSTKMEMEKLVEPLLKNPDIVATFPTIILPGYIWKTYNFWEKCLFARVVEKDDPGFSGKFDCVRKDVFIKVGGFNDDIYGEDIGIGGEDADLYLKLAKKGTVFLSKARVIHLHYLGKNYNLSDWIKNRKLLSRTYGRLLLHEAKNLPFSTHGYTVKFRLGSLIFLVKPALAIAPFLPSMQLLGGALLLLYAFMNSKTMYTTISTLSNPRIVLLPFIDIFLVYYETFWMFEAFLFRRENI